MALTIGAMTKRQKVYTSESIRRPDHANN